MYQNVHFLNHFFALLDFGSRAAIYYLLFSIEYFGGEAADKGFSQKAVLTTD